MATRGTPLTSATDRRCDLELWLTRHHYSLDTGWSWVILTGSCLAQVIISLIYVVGIFNVIFLEVFQDDRQTTAWLGAVQSSFLSLFGLPAGYINSKLGPRITTIMGALCGGLGFFLAYFANGFLSLLFTFGFLVGIGNGLVNLPSIIIMGSYFHRYRNLAFAASTATVGLGALLLPPIINYCTELYGWRGCMLIMSGIYLHLLIVGGIMRPQHLPTELLKTDSGEEKRAVSPVEKDFLVSSVLSLASVDSPKQRKRDLRYLSLRELRRNSSPEGGVDDVCQSKSYGDLPIPTRGDNKRGRANEPEVVGKRPSADRDGESVGVADDLASTVDVTAPDVRSVPSVRTRIRRILRNEKLMLLNCHYFSATGANFTSYLHFPAYFVGKGASKSDLTLMMTLVGVSNSASRLLSGILTNAVDNGVLLLYISAGGLCSFSLYLCPLLSNSYAGRLFFAFAFSFYSNAISAVRAAITLELCNLEELSLAFGIELFIGGVSGLVGPPFAGWLYDVSGDYVISFFFAGSVYMFGTLLMMLLPVLTTFVRTEPLNQSKSCDT